MGGQWEKSGDDLIGGILFLLYLFRTCHLGTRALSTPRLADSHLGRLSNVALNSSLARPAPWGPTSDAFPALASAPAKNDSARFLGKSPLL